MSQAMLTKKEFNDLNLLDQKVACLAEKIENFLMPKTDRIPEDIAYCEPETLVKSSQYIISLPIDLKAKLVSNLHNKSLGVKSSKPKKREVRVILGEEPVITVPTFIINDLKLALADYTEYDRHKFADTRDNLANPFLIPDDELEDKEELAGESLDRKKIMGVRKKGVKFSLNRECAALKKAERLNLLLKGRQKISRANAYIATINATSLQDLKDIIQYNYERIYQNYQERLQTNETVKSLRIAYKLYEAECHNEREQVIDEMIAELKSEDKLGPVRSTGLRI